MAISLPGLKIKWNMKHGLRVHVIPASQRMAELYIFPQNIIFQLDHNYLKLFSRKNIKEMFPSYE